MLKKFYSSWSILVCQATLALAVSTWSVLSAADGQDSHQSASTSTAATRRPSRTPLWNGWMAVQRTRRVLDTLARQIIS